ncbi:hypothetical protein [Rurimicrobium arvi]|uniref:Lipoprotein n=1 Tax=Rurimicrobium arvi TaxID=2049916 RepID=A0ABP8MD80_9BACT
MKNVCYLLLCSALMASCCNKHIDCTFSEEQPVQFSGFDKTDLDTILVVRYQPRTNFSVVVDSSTVAAMENYLTYPIVELQEQKYAYRIFVPATGKNYRIDNFAYTAQSCDKCIWKKKKYTNALSSYTLNEERNIGNYITIKKG